MGRRKIFAELKVKLSVLSPVSRAYSYREMIFVSNEHGWYNRQTVKFSTAYALEQPTCFATDG
jgi:hypothetical protein